MKFYILIFFLSIHIYKNQFCDEYKSCYNCSVSEFDCFWKDYSCLSKSQNKSYINNEFTSFPFLTKQYRCINISRDIEFFESITNKTIFLNLQEFNEDKINYHIYCFTYLSIQDISLMINTSDKLKNNIIEISIYDKITNSDKILNLDSNNIINIQSNYFCIKITYSKEIKDIDGSILFYIIKNDKKIKEKNSNLTTFLMLAIFLFVFILSILLFIFCSKNKSDKNKEVIIINESKERKNQSFSPDKSVISEDSKDKENNEQNECDESNCSDIQEKYFELSKDNFVEYNYETLDSFVHNLQNKEKKNIFLKTIIKTIPSFIVNKSNSEFIGIFCSFCESKIKMKDKICFINCGHIFHFDCIYQQIITNEEYKCIICNENIII